MIINRNGKIMDLSNFDYKLHVKVTATNDFIAPEVNYNTSCLSPVVKAELKSY